MRRSHSAARRDDSRAPKSPAGLVHQAHRFTCSRRGWWRAGIFAGAACLAWLAWPNLAFAQNPGVTVSETALTVPEGDSASYTVVLVTQPTDDVTITVARSSGDENLTASPDALTFTNSNWSMQQTVRILAAEDDDSENGTALFTHAVAGPGAYDGLLAPGLTATEDDNDLPGVITSETALTVPEGDSATYTVRLVTQPTDDVTITVTRSPAGDDDLTASPDTLTFTNSNWSRQQTVTILAAEDDDGKPGIAAFNHSAASPGTVYDGLPSPSVRVTENDNDSPGVIVSPTTLSVPEGGSATYTVRLGTKPLDDVTVQATRDNRSDADLTVSSDTDTDAAIDSVTLAFTNSNWNTEQTVTVTAAEDADEVDDVAIFSHTTASPDDSYYPLDVHAVTATEADNEKVVTVAIQTEMSAPVRGVFEVMIIFSEAVTGFERSDIAVTNGSVTDFSGSAPTYKAEITPSTSGEVIVEVGANVVEYGVGNGNIAGAPLVVEADLERPAVEITSEATSPVTGPFDVTITFSESVQGFTSEDIQVSNGRVADFTAVSSSEYRATITPAKAGQPVVVTVPEAGAQDGAGNGNEAAAPFKVEAKLVVRYEQERYTATEGEEPVTVTVTLSKAGDEALAIPIRVTRPETTEVGDYTIEGLDQWDAQAGTGTLTFAAEETEQTLRIAANHDGDREDETVALGFGALPEIVLAGAPAVATVTLEDKGLVELQVRFGQAAYEVKEGQAADITVLVSPAPDRRVDVPLVVALEGGTTPEDYSGVPAKVVFEEGESQGTISIEVWADEVSDSGEGIVLSVGELPEAVSAGEPASTEVHFGQQRTAQQFTPSLEGMLAVMGRLMGESARTAIEGRFARHRQWSRLGPSGGVLPPPPPGSDTIGRAGAGSRGAADSGVPRAWSVATASAAMGSGWTAEHRETGTPGSWLQSVLLGSLGNLVGSGPRDSDIAAGFGMAPGGSGAGQDRRYGAGVEDAAPRPRSGDFSERMGQVFDLSVVSFEMSLEAQEQATSWVPVVWGQGDLQSVNGDVTRIGMNYRGGLEAAHVGLDLYANDQMLTGLSFMRSLGDLEYTDDGVEGVLKSRMNTVHPYLYWQPHDRVSVWGMGGVGQGHVEVTEPGRTHDVGADLRMFAGGVRSVLTRRGNHEWGLRADAFTTQLETAAVADITPVRGDTHRGRVLLEWVHDTAFSPGRSLSLQVEAGGRVDEGAADRGSGAETGFRLGYLDAHSGLDVALQGRTLVAYGRDARDWTWDVRDWGVGVQASWDPGEKQRGFRVSVNSARGQDGGGRTTLWDNAEAVTRPAGMGAMGRGSQFRMESEANYAGLTAPGVPGTLRPYSRLHLAGQGRALSVGTQWSLPTRSLQALPWRLEVEAIKRETRTGLADRAILMRMSTPF